MGTIPAATDSLTRPRLAALKAAGVDQIALSLDGPTAERHDGFRRVAGSFGWTGRIVEAARDLGLPVQVHTTLARQTVDDLPAIADLVDTWGAVVWAVFCLVPTGRGQVADEVSAEAYERVFEWLVERRKTAGWELKLTEGYHYRRVQIQREGNRTEGLGFATTGGIGRAPAAVNAGNGFCFVSHTGDVCPSGFLPIAVGNVRHDSVVELYRNHPLFRTLRDPALLQGKCGRCAFKRVCGGSRSRAFVHSGDYLAADPACAYEPPLH
jgi:radical SAM protein with 4Fe4S-binding SPASM domain